jgi:hypothetical protein
MLEESFLMVYDVKKRLDEIAWAIQAGANPAKFEKELNKLLGTEMEERDEEAEAAFEESYRRPATET